MSTLLPTMGAYTCWRPPTSPPPPEAMPRALCTSASHGTPTIHSPANAQSLTYIDGIIPTNDSHPGRTDQDVPG